MQNLTTENSCEIECYNIKVKVKQESFETDAEFQDGTTFCQYSVTDLKTGYKYQNVQAQNINQACVLAEHDLASVDAGDNGWG